MENNIPFIHNKEEYEQYRNGPNKINLRTKVKFICHKCNKESIKRFDSLTLEFMCTSCTISRGTINVRDKYKETCLRKYGVDNPGKAKSVIEKHKKTCLERYNETSYNKTNTFKEKYKNTCLEKYGTDNAAKTDAVKEKMKKTCLEKYGTEYAIASDIVQNKIKTIILEKYHVSSTFKLKEVQDKYKETCLERYGVQNTGSLPEVIQKRKETNLKKFGFENAMSCKEIQEKCAKTKMEKYGNPYYFGDIGTICSKFEKSILKYIKDNFSNLIIKENDRKILNGKELDLYFPELQKGIEINGDYWYCNPQIYEATYVNRKGITAEEIWKKDNEKYKLAKEMTVELLVIW